MRSTSLQPFSLTGPLPSGTTVIEASAGTGKTYAIVGLAARYIAAGTSVESILLVTFSRMATAALRERMRERLQSLVAALTDHLAGHPQRGSDEDELLVAMVAGTIADVELRRDRLASALSNFDAATVCTTHTFCARMLDALGIAGDYDDGVTVVEDVDDLTDEVVADIYLQRFAEAAPLLSYRDALAIAKEAVRQPTSLLVPADAPADSAQRQRYDFVCAVRAEVDRRKDRARLCDYDELQRRLAAVLSDPDQGDHARRRIREFFSVVLIDEFQDTDPVQWAIVRQAFHRSSTVVLVGDPKQSIYAFRGAEVLSYLDAAASADNYQMLSINWRTDQRLVSGLNHLYGSAALGHNDITVREVDAHHTQARLQVPSALRLRYLGRSGYGPLNSSGFPALGSMRSAVIDDCARDIARLLASDAMMSDGATQRRIEPADVVVLLRTRKTVDPMQQALSAQGIASVVGVGSSVFTTPAGRDWFHVVQALEAPYRVDRAGLAALTPLLGWTPADIADDEGLPTEIIDLITDLAEIVSASGFAAMYEQLLLRRVVGARVLAHAGGERLMTDYGHIATLCHRYMTDNSAGIAGLARWFAVRLLDPASGDQAQQSRRLDRDSHAVTIMTVHASKGLEFPVVYIPFGWDSARNPYPATLRLHDNDGRRFIDVGGDQSQDFAAHRAIAFAEDSGEELRLLYVAATRARCATVMWWAPSTATANSPLHRLIFGRVAGSNEIQARARIPSEAEIAAAFDEWANANGNTATVEAVGADISLSSAITNEESTAAISLQTAVYHGSIDSSWRRTSYSALVADAHGSFSLAVTSEAPHTSDEPVEEISDTAGEARGGTASLMTGLPGGAPFGILVHTICESIDLDSAALTSDDFDARMRRECGAVAQRSGLNVDIEQLTRAMAAVWRTPLGLHDAGGPVVLESFSSRQMLREMEFEFPLDVAATRAIAGIADVCVRHLASDDLLADYPEQLRSIDESALRGFLTGSIDAVLAVNDEQGQSRYVVVDYKTNRIGSGDVVVEDYSVAAMTAEMIHSHYPLQALLYSVALHRYLRWRLVDYRPERHLGGVRYLFVRAMIGPETPANHGVFEWNPPATLICALSDYLGGEQ